MTKLNEYLKKLKSKNSIHVIGASGTEGSELSLFLNKHQLTNVTLHDFSTNEDTFYQNFANSHSAFPQEQFNAKLNKVKNLPYKINLGENYLKNIDSADLILVPQSWYLYPQNQTLLNLKGKIEFSSMSKLYLELFEGTTIGITGSNGKSTTTALIHHLIPHSYIVGNDRRTPQLLENIETLDSTKYLILEISNRQLVDTTGISPNIAVITNVTENHITEHTDFEEYKFLKSKIFLYQKTTDHVFLNQLDPISQTFVPKVKSNLHLYSSTSSYPEFQLKGEHNLQNLAVAVMVALHTQQTEQEIRLRLTSFSGLKDRTETVLKENDITYINDRQGTATDATIKALKSLNGNITWIFGGQNKGMHVEELCKTANELNVLAIGIESPFTDECINLLHKTKAAKDLPQAIKLAKEHTNRPGTIIFSPACEYGPYFSPLKELHPFAEEFNTLIKMDSN